MALPVPTRVRATEDGLVYLMQRARGFSWAMVERRADQDNNGYWITVAQPRNRKLRRKGFVVVTITGNQVSSMRVELMTPPYSSLPIDPYGPRLLHVTKRIQYICGYWDYPPDLLVV